LKIIFIFQLRDWATLMPPYIDKFGNHVYSLPWCIWDTILSDETILLRDTKLRFASQMHLTNTNVMKPPNILKHRCCLFNN